MLPWIVNSIWVPSQHNRKVRYRRFIPEGVVFELPALVKKSRFQHSPKTSFHAGFPENSKLCVVNCLQEYEKRTISFRSEQDDSNRLLLSYIRPHKPITSDTLSRWILEMLKNAGIDTKIFKAHSTRSATSSAAVRNNCSLKDILALADWSSDSTFKRFYYRPVYNQSILHNVFTASSNSSWVALNLHCYIEATDLKYNFRLCEGRLRPEV